MFASSKMAGSPFGKPLGENDIFSSIIKATFFGYAIGFISSYAGYHSSNGTAGVGKAANTAVVISGVLAALGGAFLSIGFVNSFNENMTAGRGFIALAALIFGNWRPKGLLLACLLFGAGSAIAPRLAVYSDSAAILFQTLPYVLTLIAVAGLVGRPRPPASIGLPFLRR